MIGRAIIFKKNTAEMSELLESDDKQPDSRDENPYVPAYQDDRSEPLEPRQQQLEDASSQPEQKPNSLETEPHATNKTLPTTEVKKKPKRILIARGILSKRDIFFVKSIEQHVTETTLLWFINYLKNKSEQPVPTSCLVADITSDHYNAAKEKMPELKMKYYLKLVTN